MGNKNSPKMAFTLVGNEDTLRAYDEICGIAFINIFTLSKDYDKIVLAPFDAKNEEHLFLLYAAKGMAGVVEKDVYVDTNRLRLLGLNKGIKKGWRIQKASKEDIAHAINPEEVLDYMREYAESLCGKNFNFGKIYREFYKRKKGK